MNRLIIILVSVLLTACGNYSFSGKSIPPNVKSAQLILFEDNSGRYDLSLPEILNEGIAENIESYNFFELNNSSEADAKISGTVKSYSEKISSQTRDEEIDQMVVSITVEVDFYNNGTDEYIVKALRISDSEYFEASGGDEARNEAFNTLIERMSEKIVLGLKIGRAHV